jgi:hypothetical protein
MSETITEFMYEGKSRENLQKIIDMKFAGNNSLDARMSRLFYMAMYDSLEILGPHVVNGETAIEVSELIATTIANLMVVLHVNLYPKEVSREIFAMTMINLATTAPAFMESTMDTMDKHKEEESTAIRN